MWKGGEEAVYHLQLGGKKQKLGSCGMHKKVYWRRQHGGVVGEERLTLASAAWGWEQAEGAFASCGLHTRRISASPSHGPDARHHFSYRSSTLLGTSAIRLQAGLCFCQCWTWHALQRGKLVSGAVEPHPSLGAKEQQGQTPAPHPSGSWGRADTAQH